MDTDMMDSKNTHQYPSSSTYQKLYQALDTGRFQVRLLTLSPGAFQDPITGAIDAVFLDESPRYTALSYEWGHSPAPSPIHIASASVTVTKNLDTGLRHLRHHASNRSFWVDAICINQADPKEKADQVKQIGLVYSKAETVIAWLGSADVSFKPVETFLSNLHDTRRDLRSQAPDLKQPTPKRSETYNDPRFPKALRKQHRPNKVIDGLLQLFSRSYWERVWIIQEISRASNVEVWFGQFRAHLDPLLLASRHLKNLSERTRTLLAAIIEFRTQEQGYGGLSPNARMSLFDALIISRYSLATDPRDKVYALLGMTCDGTNLVPLPTYASSVETVFHDLTSAIIRSEQPSNVLLLANWIPAKEIFEGATRWCIDWADLNCLPPWLTKVERSKSRTIATSSRVEFQGSELVTQGWYVGSLQGVQDPTQRFTWAPPGSLKEDAAHETKILKQLTSDLLSRFAPGLRPTTSLDETEITDALARMIMDVHEGNASACYDMSCVEDILYQLGSLPLEGNPVWEWAIRYNYFRAAKKPVNEGSTRTAALLRDVLPPAETQPQEVVLSPCPPPPSPSAFQFWVDVVSVLEAAPEFNLRFALAETVSSGRHLVLVCNDAKSNDLIYQIEGSNLPVVLRKSSNRFDFIGDICLGRRDTGEWSRHNFAASAENPFDIKRVTDVGTPNIDTSLILHINLEGDSGHRPESYESLYGS